MADLKRQSTARKPGRPKGSTSKSSSTSRQTGSSSRGKKGTSRKSSKQEDMGFMRAEVMIICSFAVAVLLFLSNFHLCGFIGEALRGFQLGIFGCIGYLFPLLLFVGTCFFLSNRGNLHAQIKLAAVCVLMLTLCGLLEMLFGKIPAGASPLEYYGVSSLNGRGGGLLGGVLSSLLTMGVGRAGAYLILVVLIILCAVCITERSFVSLVKKGGDKAYQYAREDMDRRRELHAQRAEERKRLREEQKVRGVNLEATRLEPSQAEFDEEAFDREFGAELEPISETREEKQKEETVREKSSLADRFVGKIHLPSDVEQEDDVQTEEMQRTFTEPEPEKQERDFVSAAYRTAASMQDDVDNEEDESFEKVYAERDSRTLEEMGMGTEEQTAPDSFSWPEEAEDEEVYAYEKKTQESEEAPFEEDYDMDSYIGETEDYTEKKSRELFEEPLNAQGPDTYDPYVQEPSEEGVNYDSLFVPEEPKRVVTASGKIIETETDLLQKKIEKKKAEVKTEREEAGIPPVRQEPVKKEYVFPPLDLLKRGDKNSGSFSEDEFKATAIKLQQTLHNFGVGVTVTNISCGPSVTRYELLPEQGVKVSKIVSLTDDIKLSLAAADIRIEAPIPGKSAVGIEVPNKENKIVYLRELLESEAFKKHKSSLAFAVGKDIGGQTVVTDIAKMPHLLIAGATGSGKSVCINTLIMSIIYKAKPEDVRLIMVDPKVVELSVYKEIPHLLIPVVTDPKKASGALNWAVAEMTERYKKFAQCNVRDLKGYNEKVEKVRKEVSPENAPEKLPQIVIIIDELADLMMVAPGEVEDSICRLAQLARAAGIHLVIATQRPSVNVITGLIKANVPSRIAFSVSSGVDSRTIIDMNGAEKLLGKGDMLFYPVGFPKPQRVQGAFVSDEEVARVVDFLSEQGMTAQYSAEVESHMAAPAAQGGSSDAGRDEYFVQAGKFIIEKDKASIGMLQRMFKIGFNRAARIMDQLADAGVVGEEEGTKPRKVLMSAEQFEEMLEQGL